MGLSLGFRARVVVVMARVRIRGKVGVRGLGLGLLAIRSLYSTTTASVIRVSSLALKPDMTNQLLSVRATIRFC